MYAMRFSPFKKQFSPTVSIQRLSIVKKCLLKSKEIFKFIRSKSNLCKIVISIQCTYYLGTTTNIFQERYKQNWIAVFTNQVLFLHFYSLLIQMQFLSVFVRERVSCVCVRSSKICNLYRRRVVD